MELVEKVKERFSHIKTLVINLDNGPENHSRRTQFMQRLLEFVQCYHITFRLAYYPPYHSKYNSVERCWGILEQHFAAASFLCLVCSHLSFVVSPKIESR
jgi:transposase